MNVFYDRDGSQITEQDWLTKTEGYRRIALSKISTGGGEYRVSTLWAGIDMRAQSPNSNRVIGATNRPAIFETAVVGPDGAWVGSERWFYTSLQLAEEGHREAVTRITAKVVNVRLHRHGELTDDPWRTAADVAQPEVLEVAS